jgi:hypothetical protein
VERCSRRCPRKPRRSSLNLRECGRGPRADESGHSRFWFWPESAACSMDARSSHRGRVGARHVSRGPDYRLVLGLNAALGLFRESRRTSPPESLTSAATTARSESFTTSPGNHFCCGAVFHPAALDRGGPRKPRLQCCKRRLVDQSTLFQCPPRPVLVSDRDGGNVWCRRCHILPTHRHLGSCLPRTRARPDASSSGASRECNIG